MLKIGSNMTWNAILKNTVKSDAQEKSLPVGIFYTEKEEKRENRKKRKSRIEQ